MDQRKTICFHQLCKNCPKKTWTKSPNYARNYIEEFNARNQGVEIIVSRAFLDILQSRLHLLSRNGLMGFLLVIIALSMFLSFRLSLWVSIGIPISFLGMFIVASFMGVTINLQSLFGMILVIGILVDDGIVIAENIYLHFERGKGPCMRQWTGPWRCCRRFLPR